MFTRQKMTPALFTKGTDSVQVEVPGWPNRDAAAVDSSDFVCTLDHDQVLSQMLLSHHSADFCLVGGKVRRVF